MTDFVPPILPDRPRRPEPEPNPDPDNGPATLWRMPDGTLQEDYPEGWAPPA